MDKATVTADGVEVAYRQSDGPGPPVLFIHGNSSSGNTWRHQLDGVVGTTFHCTAMDLPGHGSSAARPDPADYSLPGYAAAVAGLASALDIDDAVLVGWSLGGHIALESLSALPRCRGVLIFGTPPLGIPPALEEGFLPNPAMSVGFSDDITTEDAKAYARSFLAPDSSVSIDDFVRDIEATNGAARSGLQASISELRMADELEILATMPQPLAIVQGAGEQLVSTSYLQSVEAPTLWRDEVQMIPDAGHAPHVETPGHFDTLLTEFIRDC